MGNGRLHAAKAAKNDEFYTRREDIEEEIQSYVDWNPNVFQNKTVLLPCDDPDWSDFTKYFADNFKKLGLKKLISTCYAGGFGGKTAIEIERISPLFNPGNCPKGKLLVMERNADGIPGTPMFGYLRGDGDFRSGEVKKLRDQADFIITNPPFSLFREFVSWLQDGGKKFIVMGNKNAISYKEFFPLLKNNKVWSGYTSLNGGRWMRLPKDIDVQSAAVKDDGRGGKILNVAGVCWFTNVEHWNRHRSMEFHSMVDNLQNNAKLRKKFLQDYGSADAYPRYDNFDAIEVPYVDAIPKDYPGAMGVPITFLDKYNPEQFEILGSFNNSEQKSKEADGYVPSADTPTIVNGVEQIWNGPVINKKPLYKRIVVRFRHPESQNAPDLPNAATADNNAKEEYEGLRSGR